MKKREFKTYYGMFITNEFFNLFRALDTEKLGYLLFIPLTTL